jgi:hypothetical protein
MQWETSTGTLITRTTTSPARRRGPDRLLPHRRTHDPDTSAPATTFAPHHGGTRAAAVVGPSQSPRQTRLGSPLEATAPAVRERELARPAGPGGAGASSAGLGWPGLSRLRGCGSLRGIAFSARLPRRAGRPHLRSGFRRRRGGGSDCSARRHKGCNPRQLVQPGTPSRRRAVDYAPDRVRGPQPFKTPWVARR